MRKLFLWLPSLLFIVFISFSCKKESMNEDIPQNPSNEMLIPKIKTWLNEQTKGLPAASAEIIKTLESNLSYGEIRLEKYKETKEFIVIPISPEFKSKNNVDKKPANYLVLAFENHDSISSGNIIQYISSNISRPVPVNTFYKIFTYKDLDCSGRFTILNITDNFQYELKFNQGKLESVAERSKKNNERNDSGRMNTCIDWYLVTTYYYTDGSSSTTEEYLFTQCDDPCEETRSFNGRSYRTNCGGGGGNNIEYQYALSRPWKWDVATTANWWAESYETVSAVRNINEPQGGHFTAISHNSSYFATNLPGYTWQEVGYVVSIDNPQRVYATATGRVSQGVTVNTYSGYQFKSFAELIGFSSQ
jgi:hypothetical protein